jgi:hypothetical protein
MLPSVVPYTVLIHNIHVTIVGLDLDWNRLTHL